MKIDIAENLRILQHAVKNPPKRDMKEHEDELHNEIRAHLWFLEKTGWSRKEIDFATLMRIDKNTILEYLGKIE